MGKILRTKRFTTGFELFLLVIGLAIVSTGLYFFAPGLRVGESQQVDAMDLNKDSLNNVTYSALLDLPTNAPSPKVSSRPVVRIAGYAWNGQTPIITANGGPYTTKGSLMEAQGVNLNIVRQDWLSELRAMQMKFIELYDKNPKSNPSELSDKAAFAIMIMGDGAPFYISTMQSQLDAKFGKDKYHVQVIGCIGMSNGEDKLIGPKKWKSDPQSMRGSLISTVPGDGDWVTTLNYCGVNNIPVNPDFSTYDPNAVNFYPSADDDYINSAKELIASQTEGFKVTLDEVKDGKLTGETVTKKIDGCATWTPGDKMVFDALASKGYTDIASTADFPNQMATTIIAFKEWADDNPETVTGMLKAAYIASNQIKQYDQWAVRGSEAVASTFQLESPKYWYDMFKGQTGHISGNSYNMGGTRVLNYADAMQYYGLSDGVNRYKSVYNQVSSYLTELNPFDFNSNVSRVVSYDDAVNLYFLQNIENVDTGAVSLEVDYSVNKTNVLANGEWHINFETGSSNIKSNSNSELDKIYNLLVQAEQTKVSIIGHTDDTGSDNVNIPLSKDRANSVVEYLVGRGISEQRIQLVDGKGSKDPIASNSTSSGRAENRRVQITLFQ